MKSILNGSEDTVYITLSKHDLSTLNVILISCTVEDKGLNLISEKERLLKKLLEQSQNVARVNFKAEQSTSVKAEQSTSVKAEQSTSTNKKKII